MLAGDRWPGSAAEACGEVLLLHGAGQTRHSWHPTARRLAAAGYGVTTVDARGHGDSGWAAAGEYSLSRSVQDLAAIVQTFATPPVVVGASMGGLTALVAEGEYGGIANALVLVDIAPRIESGGRARIVDFMNRGLEGFESVSQAADEVRRYNPRRSRPATEDGLLRNLRQREDGRWYWHWDPEWLKESHVDDRPERDAHRAREAARSLQVPTLIVRAIRSDVLSDAGVAELLELVPRAEFAQVDAGHMVAGDDNDAFTQVLLDFLARH